MVVTVGSLASRPDRRALPNLFFDTVTRPDGTYGDAQDTHTCVLAVGYRSGSWTLTWTTG